MGDNLRAHIPGQGGSKNIVEILYMLNQTIANGLEKAIKEFKAMDEERAKRENALLKQLKVIGEEMEMTRLLHKMKSKPAQSKKRPAVKKVEVVAKKKK